MHPIKIACKCHKVVSKRCYKNCLDGRQIDNYCYEECYESELRECIIEECKRNEKCIREALKRKRYLDEIC